MVLPGTIWQVPLMNKIKSMGHELYLANPVKNKGVYEIADHFLETDIFAYDTIISYCNFFGNRLKPFIFKKYYIKQEPINLYFA